MAYNTMKAQRMQTSQIVQKYKVSGKEKSFGTEAWEGNVETKVGYIKLQSLRRT
jgi:hypothetical protein